MKKYIIIIIVVLILFSCKSRSNNNEEDVTILDLIHTDSFSPKSWEMPINRKYVNFGDTDIGELLQKSVIEPKLHGIYNTTERFFNIVSNSKLDNLVDILTPSAYNSFILRFKGISFIDAYELRIGKPKNIDSNEFRLRVKLIFEDKNIIGTIGYEFNNSQCMILDFEDKLFYDIIKSTTPRKEKTSEDNTNDSRDLSTDSEKLIFPSKDIKDKTTDIIDNSDDKIDNTID